MKKPVAPCKDCKPPKRSSTCHGTCEEYITFKREKDAYDTEYRKQIKEIDMYKTSYRRKQR